MKNLKIAVAQFEPKDGDKSYNLKVIEKLTGEAKRAGAEVISFHEMSITAYTFLKNCNKEEAFSVAEEVPKGSSTLHLIELAKKYDITILAGLVELEQDKIYNTYICVDSTGLKAKFRKLHPFISEFLSPGNEYCTFEIKGWKENNKVYITVSDNGTGIPKEKLIDLFSMDTREKESAFSVRLSSLPG